MVAKPVILISRECFKPKSMRCKVALITKYLTQTFFSISGCALVLKKWRICKKPIAFVEIKKTGTEWSSLISPRSTSSSFLTNSPTENKTKSLKKHDMKSLRFDLQVYCVQKIFLSYGNWIERKIGGTLGDQRPALRERRNNGEKESMKMKINTLLTVPGSQRIRRVGKKRSDIWFLYFNTSYELRISGLAETKNLL